MDAGTKIRRFHKLIQGCQHRVGEVGVLQPQNLKVAFGRDPVINPLLSQPAAELSEIDIGFKLFDPVQGYLATLSSEYGSPPCSGRSTST